MDIEKVIEQIREQYEAAKKTNWVQRPLAYALWQVWKEVDRKERRREESET